MAGFDEKVVAAALDAAALPSGPLRIHEQVMTAGQRSERFESPPSAHCLACGGSGQYPLTVTDEGVPLSWRPCPACRPTPADVEAHERTVAKYGRDHF